MAHALPILKGFRSMVLQIRPSKTCRSLYSGEYLEWKTKIGYRDYGLAITMEGYTDHAVSVVIRSRGLVSVSYACNIASAVRPNNHYLNS